MKPKPVAEFRWDDLDRAIEASLASSRPPGTFTLEEFRQQYKVKSWSAAHTRLRRLRLSGVIQRVALIPEHELRADGKIQSRRVAYYRMVK